MRGIAWAAVVCALTAGCGGGGTERVVAIAGGTEEQRALLRSIVDAFSPTELRRVVIIGTPADSMVELRMTPSSSSGPDSLRAWWEALVVAGVFRDRSAEERLGNVTYVDGNHIGAVPPAPTSPSATERAAMTIAALVSAPHATVEELRFTKPDGLALELVLRVSDPAAFLTHRLLPLEAVWRNDRLEGSYILVEDETGELVMELASTARIQASSRRIRPDLAGCNPFPLYGPHGEPPPPCPATLAP